MVRVAQVVQEDPVVRMVPAQVHAKAVDRPRDRQVGGRANGKPMTAPDAKGDPSAAAMATGATVPAGKVAIAPIAKAVTALAGKALVAKVRRARNGFSKWRCNSTPTKMASSTATS